MDNSESRTRVRDIRHKRGSNVLILRRGLYHRLRVLLILFFRTKIVRFGALALLALLFLYRSSPKNVVRADEVTFLPSSCLGGWQNVKAAEGKFETTVESPATDYTEDTSAYLPKESLADIYCGSFEGSIPEKTAPDKVVLTLSWKMRGDINPIIVASTTEDAARQALEGSKEAEIHTSTTTATTTEEKKDEGNPGTGKAKDGLPPTQTDRAPDTTSPTQPPSGPVETPVEIPKGGEEPAAAPPEGLRPVESVTGVLAQLFGVRKLFAEEEGAATTPSATTEPSQTVGDANTSNGEENVPAPAPDSPGDTVITPQIINERGTSSEDHPIISTLATDTEVLPSPVPATTTPVDAPQADKMYFFEVLYTLDGTHWESLGKFEASDVHYTDIVLPFQEAPSWKDLSKIQVSIKSLQSFDGKETLFLDGMKLTAHYLAAEKVERKYYVTHVRNSSNDFKLSLTEDSLHKKFLFASATEDVPIAIYAFGTTTAMINASSTATSTQENLSEAHLVMTSKLTVNGMQIDPNNGFEFGNYVIVANKDENWCSDKTLEECVSAATFVATSTFEVIESLE